MDKDNSLDKYLKSLEDLHNGPGESEIDEVGLNRIAYINELLTQNFLPTEELLRLYSVYMAGLQDSWWCRASLTFREFVNTMRLADLKQGRYKKDYRKGFSDGIRFMLESLAD